MALSFQRPNGTEDITPQNVIQLKNLPVILLKASDSVK